MCWLVQKMAQFVENCHKSKMGNLISPLYFRKLNYIIWLFSNNWWKIEFKSALSPLCSVNFAYNSMPSPIRENHWDKSRWIFHCKFCIQRQTRPDTRQSSRGWLGRSSNAKTAQNLKMWRTDRQTNLPTDTARCSRVSTTKNICFFFKCVPNFRSLIVTEKV